MNKKPRICLCTSGHPATDIRIFQKEARTLAREGYDVTLIAQHKCDETIDGVRIIGLPSTSSRFKRMICLSWKVFCLARKQRASVYQISDTELLPFAFLLKCLTGCRIVYDVLEDFPGSILSKHWIYPVFRGLIAGLFTVFEKWIARHFDYVVAAAEDIRGNFKHHRIATVRNFPPVALAEDSPASRMHSGKKEHVLIYIGGLSKIRGICEIIRALEVMRVELPVRLELVGSFSPPDFEDEIRQLKGFARTEYLGVKPWADVMEHLRHADIGLVCFHPEPNHLFPRSNKLFEYMSVGLPVIASNFPQWKAIVEGSNCGLTVNPLDPGEIAQAIEYLIRHPDEARKMGENGRKAVLEKYNWEKEGKELLRVYEELTKR